MSSKNAKAKKAAKKAASKPKMIASGGKKKSKKKSKEQYRRVQAHVQATYNNTIVTVTDVSGNVIAWGSAGFKGFKGPKKSTPFAATTIVEDIMERVKERHGIHEIDIFLKGVGAGREATVRAFNACGISVNSIKDTTPIPHNGPRAKKPRRV